MTDLKRLDPVEAGARALAQALACTRCGRQYDATFATQHADHCGACAAIVARAALTAAVPAIPEKRLDALRFAVTPEEVRGVLLRALTGQEKD